MYRRASVRFVYLFVFVVVYLFTLVYIHVDSIDGGGDDGARGRLPGRYVVVYLLLFTMLGSDLFIFQA